MFKNTTIRSPDEEVALIFSRSMGRDWLYKASSGSGRGGGGRKSSSATDRTKPKYTNISSPGCMSAIYNLFDIQQQQFRFRHPSLLSVSAINDSQHSNFCLQGIEAPRNSLESPESSVDTNVASSSSEVEEPTNLNIQVGRIQIESIAARLSSECCNSPGTKTPNLIARLMGLDLLPEHSSPRPSSSSTVSSYNRSRSLPATPRLSTTSRGSKDKDYHHRMSLQIDKENCNRFKGPMDSSPYVKQISNPARRLGTDITNTRNRYHRRDSNLDMLKPKLGESRQLSSSPKVRLLDIKSNLNKPVSNSHSTWIKKVKLKSERPKFRQMPGMKQGNLVKVDEIKRIASERFDLRLKKMNQQEKVFVSKKKSTALANHGLNAKKFGPFKKDMASASSTTRRLSQKQVSLPSNLNSPYNPNGTHNLKPTTTSVLKPCMNQKPLIICPRLPDSCVMCGSDVIKDLCEKSLRRLLLKEVEDIVRDIERGILENLVDDEVGRQGLTG